MARTWLSIRVELVSGRGTDFWPRPGREFAAAQSHTFDQLATAIDLAFARWDLAHMRSFTLANGTPVTSLDQWDGDEPEGSVIRNLAPSPPVPAHSPRTSSSPSRVTPIAAQTGRFAT